MIARDSDASKKFYRTVIFEIQDLPLLLSHFWALKRECSELHDRWKGKNGQKERWRLNLEELKLKIKSSSEKFRRLHRMKKGLWGFYVRICLGVLRTLGLYINFRQWAINGHSCCVLSHALSPQRAQARLGEEMFMNGYALITWKRALTTIPKVRFSAQYEWSFPRHVLRTLRARIACGARSIHSN